MFSLPGYDNWKTSYPASWDEEIALWEEADEPQEVTHAVLCDEDGEEDPFETYDYERALIRDENAPDYDPFAETPAELPLAA